MNTKTPNNKQNSPELFTKLLYCYRDAANYKASSTIWLEGTLTPANVRALEKTLDSGEYFIPEDLVGLGIRELQEELTSFPSEDDHVWHTLDLEDLEVVAALDEGETSIPVSTFLDAFQKVAADGGWKVAEAVERLGV